VRERDIDVVELDMSIPFTAARARNAGFRRIRQLAPGIEYVQFVDGDCELIGDWPESALRFLESHADVAAVCGVLYERHPEKSVYNWLCNREWNGPMGEVRACGGNVFMRLDALASAGGFREDVIAGEDDELCVRLRAGGWRIWRIGSEMAWHDAAMMHFNQWWRRAVRCGYALAQGYHLHGASREQHWRWESRRAWLFGVWLPLGLTLASIVFSPWGWLLWLVYPIHVLQKALRGTGSSRERLTLALFHVLGHFAEGWGEIKFLYDKFFRRQPHLIEYK
jgi:GT2 family glycosyltransferase